MGFCMGGALTLAMSQSGKIDCGAPCYGLPSEGHGKVSAAAPQIHPQSGNETAVYSILTPFVE